MISIDFLTLSTGDTVGFSIDGHSGYAEEGSDIVCAAVSSAAFMAANTVSEVLGVSPIALRAEDGDMLLRVEKRDAPACRDILQGFKIHLLGLEEQYADFIRVGYVEV